jgi:hypothetical protein
VIGRDGVVGLICLAGSLGLLWTTRGLPHPALVPIGPAFYPGILLTATALLSAGLLAWDLLGRRRPAPAPPPAGYRLVAATFLVFTLYVALLPALGYRLATFLFVAALGAALEPAATRRWWLVAVVALGTMAITYLVFERYLLVLLPRGRLTGF